MAKLYIIAGHGAGDSGAVGHGFTEAERVRTLCSRIKELGGSNVEYLDSGRNWYADGGIKSLNIPKTSCLLECHMDSGAASAHGGHVIKASGTNVDASDNSLVDLFKQLLPGRAEMLVFRDNLANPKRAKSRGINYRLAEFGFITNSNDISVFNNKIDEIAKGVLRAFGIDTVKKEEVTMANVFQYTLDGGDKQLWRIESIGNKFMFKNKYNGEYLDVAGGQAKNGANVQTYKKNNTKAQQWTLEQIKSGYNPSCIAPITIVSAIDNKSVVDILAGGKSNGANADIYAPNGTNAQKFYAIDTGDGYCIFLNVNSLKALSV